MGAWFFTKCPNTRLTVPKQSLISEKLISFREAVKVLPDRPHPSTMWRWCLRGVRGIRLESWVVGGRRYTTADAIARFIAATTAAANGERPASRTSRQREEAIDRADEELRKEGF
jgi:hypothetical protein